MSFAPRYLAAQDKFIDYCVDNAGISHADAHKALKYLKKHKLIKLDPVDGRFSVKHGAFLETEALLKAAELWVE